MCYSRNQMIEDHETMDPGLEHEQLMADSPTSIEFFQLAQEDCPHCGGLGYTIEANSEDGPTMVGCFRCWIAHQENNIPTLPLRDEVQYPETLTLGVI